MVINTQNTVTVPESEEVLTLPPRSEEWPEARCDGCGHLFNSREAGLNEHMGDYVCDECLADREAFLKAIYNTPETYINQLTTEEGGDQCR
jgi:hypothetical protein